jgi:hypothetical protein
MAAGAEDEELRPTASTG